MATNDIPKFNPPPVAPTMPSVAPLVQEQQRSAALPNRIDSGALRPTFPPQYTQPQAAPSAPVQGDAVYPTVPKVPR